MSNIHSKSLTTLINMASLNMERDMKAVAALGGADLSAAEEASKFIENAVQYDRSFHLIQEVQKASHQHRQGSVVYMRYISLLCKISTFGDEEFRACEEAGAIKDIVTECMTDDILVQINTIGLLTGVGSTVRGLEYMCDKGVFDWLIWASCGAVVSSANASKSVNNANPVDPLIRIEALRVLGFLFARSAALNFDAFGHMHQTFVFHFLHTVHRYLEGGNEEERMTSLATLSEFAVISLTTLQLVVEGTHSGVPPGQMLSAWMGLLTNSKVEMVGAVLQSVAVVLDQTDEHYVTAAHPHPTPFVTDHASTDARMQVGHHADPALLPDLGKREVVVHIKKRLLSAIGEAKRTNTISLLMRLALQPIEATRFPAVNLLRAVAAQPSGWGLQLLFALQGASIDANFYEYLIERVTEYCKEGKDHKFALIQAVAQNPSRGHLPAEVNQKIDLMVQQGAYYLPPMVELQTMEG